MEIRLGSAVLILALVAAVGCGLGLVGSAPTDESGGAPPSNGDGSNKDDAASQQQADGAVIVNDAGNNTTNNDAGGADTGAVDGGSVSPLCPPQADLMACIAFENNVADDSPRHITLTATNLTFGAGRQGQAGQFTLTPKTNVRMPEANMNTPRATVELWFKASSLPTTRAYFLDMQSRFGITLESDGSFFCRSIKATQKVVVGQWVHLACTNDGTTMTAYVGGVAGGSAANVLGTTSDFIGVGQDSPDSTGNIDGFIDSLRIWSEARTPAQIAAAAAAN